MSTTGTKLPDPATIAPGTGSGSGTVLTADGVLAGYITPPKLAEKLGVTLRTLQRWEACGIGPPRVVIGQTILYSCSSLSRWLEAHERWPTGRRGTRRAG